MVPRSGKADKQVCLSTTSRAAVSNNISRAIVSGCLWPVLRSPGCTFCCSPRLCLADSSGDDPILHSYWNLHYGLGLGLADAEADGDLDALGLSDADGDRLALAEADGLVKSRLSNTRQGLKYVFSRRSSLA